MGWNPKEATGKQLKHLPVVQQAFRAFLSIRAWRPNIIAGTYTKISLKHNHNSRGSLRMHRQLVHQWRERRGMWATRLAILAMAAAAAVVCE